MTITTHTTLKRYLQDGAQAQPGDRGFAQPPHHFIPRYGFARAAPDDPVGFVEVAVAKVERRRDGDKKEHFFW
jgi:hypothetical protein